MVLAKLERRGLIGRQVGARDRRTRTLALTAAGDAMLRRLRAPAGRVIARQLSAFSPRERRQFLDMLEKFTRTFNESTRVPLEAQRTNGKATESNRRKARRGR